MKLLANIRSSTIWLVMPALFVACMVGFVVAGYEPLLFDPNLVQQAQAAQSAKLKTRSVEEEAPGNASEGDGTPAPADAATPVSGTVAANGLADGTWTGYAACGKGNSDGWKPYYVAVTIEVKNGRVAKIASIQGTSTSDSGAPLNWDAPENQSYLDWAVSGRAGDAGVRSQLDSALSAGKAPSGLDTVSGATYSSVAIYNAYVAAVNKASKAGSGKSAAKKKSVTKKSGKKNKTKKNTRKKATDKTGDEVSKATLADGSWVGFAACGQGNDQEWSPYYVKVTVVVEGGKVKRIADVSGASKGEARDTTLNWKEQENQAYLDWAASGRVRGGKTYTGVLEQIDAALSKGTYPSSIDVVSGATYSSEAILHAFYAALRKSAAAAGSQVDIPESPGGNGSGEGGSEGDPAGDDPQGESSGPSQPSGGEPGEPGGSGDDSQGASTNPTDGDSETSVALVDGSYSGYALCKNLDSPKAYSPYYVIVEIEVTGGKVSSISNVYGDSQGIIDSNYKYDSKENATYLNFAIDGIGRRVKGVKAQIQASIDAGEPNPVDIDMVSSATWSSKSIIEAYQRALASVPEA